ncbi:hypothetical protein [Texcoconibacillus texcoconensis]|uniref:Putative membrane protein n=1 Tax=Texcoconibacillus texcoconensis TaxID=1095777 RepID=A0A840QHZ6_9BACI|nr:hypothetical protein [Texcoconibacillus texcoconensis]MBB5171964.1 putative membrane protein [Texcoconibacillus texcoconensis]
MFLYLLMIILLIISFASFSAADKAEKEKKGSRFTFSVTLAIMLPFIIEGTVQSLRTAQIISGTSFFIILFFALPSILFTTLQLILYDIGFTKNKR